MRQKQINASIWPIMVGAILLMAGCQNSDESSNSPDYLSDIEPQSFQQVYPALLARAKEWDAEAGLDIAVVEFNPKAEYQSRDVSAFFRSPNQGPRYLFVEHHLDGTITSKIGGSGDLYGDYTPVEATDKILDSPEAWDIFLQNKDILTYDKENLDCAELLLLREGTDSTIVLWRLAIWDCEAPEMQFFHIDARTGEQLIYD